MNSLIYIALIEGFTALIIWALIERFGHISRKKGKPASFGIFIILWVMLFGLHLGTM